jgi:hypothetical protein
VAEAMAKSGDSRTRTIVVQALAAIREIEKPWKRHSANRNIASAFAWMGHFVEAIMGLGKVSLDDFLSELVDWTDALEKKQTGLAISILCEATCIVGWVRPDWRDIHELLVASKIPRSSD